MVCVVGLWVWSTLLSRTSTIDAVTIVRGDIESHVAVVGTLQPRRYVDVGAQVSGQIQRIFVQPGDVVKQGQLLAEIDSSLLQAKVDADQAALTGLKFQLADQQAQLALARQQYARQQQLAQQERPAKRTQIAQATLRSVPAKIGVLKAQIEQMRSTLKGDKAQLGYPRICAPMAGVVVSLATREGQTLNAAQQTPLLLRIADLSTMTVWTDVPEADVGHVQPGMPVYFTTLGVDNHRWTSKVRQILPTPTNISGLSGNGPLSPPRQPPDRGVVHRAVRCRKYQRRTSAPDDRARVLRDSQSRKRYHRPLSLFKQCLTSRASILPVSWTRMVESPHAKYALAYATGRPSKCCRVLQ